MTDYKFNKDDRVEALRDCGLVREGDKGTVMVSRCRPWVKWDRVVDPEGKGKIFLSEPSEHVWCAHQEDLRLITDESNPTVRAALLNAKQAIDDAMKMLGGES